MNPEEYKRMAECEMQHWWYLGLRDAILQTLALSRCALPDRARVLDAGCGTGGNLRLLQDHIHPAYLGGFDLSPLAVAAARQRVPEADVYTSDICNPDLHLDAYDLIVSCDVVYIPGAQAAFDGLTKLAQRLCPGGLMIVNLPAYNWLYSEHDVALHTSERYTVGRVRKLLVDLGLTVQLATYRLCLLFPAVVLTRVPSILGKKPDQADARSNLRMPTQRLNATLRSILKCENTAIRYGVRFPWGSSVYAVASKNVNRSTRADARGRRRAGI